MSKLKKGLTYISERTNQIRYSDKNQNEQWLQPLAIYKVADGQTIKRGQPVSVAGKEQDTDNTVLVELTNPLKHTSSLGLAMEPGTEGSIIHVVDAGQFVVNTDYYKKAKLDESLIKDGTSLVDFIKKSEYLPKFLFNKDNIGKPIFVKGEASGELTIEPEEAYLAHNNVIQVGFIADTFENAMVENEIIYEKLLDTTATISLQFEGDSRGPIDNTQFEMVTGEEIYIPENKEIAIAMGHQDSENFEFKFGFRKQLQPITEDGFIAIRKCDGKTAYLSYNPDFSPKVLGKGKSTEDSAFIEIANAYSTIEPQIIKLTKNVNGFTNETLDELIEKLSEALTFVDGAIFNASERYVDEDSACVRLKSKKDGGHLEVYISENYLKVFELMRVYSAGANENKGKAILADIRDADRQNVIGLYSSSRPENGVVPKGTKIIVNHLGMKNSRETLVAGSPYYLGSRGTLTTVPQDYYNSVVKIGYAETENRIFISCDQPRKYWNGTLPVGYMKPTVHGQAEYGFVIMDGVTELLYEDYKALYEALKSSINLKLYPSKSPSHMGETVFVLPKLVYNIEWKDETNQGLEMAQVKYLQEGVYVTPPAHPFVKYEGNASASEGIVNLPTIDITKLMYFSPIGEDLRSVSDTDIDLRIFVDCRDTLTDVPVWTELHSGFKHINNFDYYGFEWHIESSNKADDAKTKEYKVVFTNNLTHPDNKIKAHGPMIERDPFEPPISIEGMPIRIIVERHPLWQGQFDFHGMFDDLVSQHVLRIDAATPTDEAVSGKAVDEFIKNSVTTADLTIEKPNHEAGKLTAKIVNSKIETTRNTNNVPSLEIIGDLQFTHGIDGTDDVVLFANGTFGYYKVDNISNKLRPLTAEETNLLKKRFGPSSLIPHQYLIAHENEKVADEEKRGSDKEGPHGIINDGATGNLHAVDVNNAQIGTPNAKFGSFGSLEKFYNIRLPFIYTKSSIDKPYGDDFEQLLTKTLKIQGNKELATVLFDSNNVNYNVTSNTDNVFTVDISQGGTKFSHIYDFEKKTYSVLTPDGEPARELAPSTIQAKNLTNEFNSTYSNMNFSTVEEFLRNNDAETHEDSTETKEYFNTTLKQNALEALSFMPTAVFQYRSEPSQLKRWFGIITERLAEAKTLLNPETDISGKIGQFKKDGTLSEDFDKKLTYHFSEEEIKSMKEYLNFVTNNNDTAQNVLSTVGILLEAAKETQMRLLPNEASIFGEDAETIPGARTPLNDKAPSYATNTPTHLGLNRLVKALCAEIFLDADPTEITQEGGTGPDPKRYSRLDKVCKAIYGQESSENPGEEQEAIPLSAVASTYPKEVKPNDRTTYWDEIKTTVPSEDEFEDITLPQFETNEWFKSQDITPEGKVAQQDGSSAPKEFDGLNEAINRITVKLNRLTTEIHDEDNINTSTKALDRIRTNIETLLKEVYSEKDYKDIQNSEPFVKAGPSRFDKLTSDLYGINIKLENDKNLGNNGTTSRSTEADYNEDGTTKRTFNGKPLKGKHNKAAEGASEGNTVTAFVSKKPETMDEIGKWANVIDILIDIIGGTENDIVRSNNTSDLRNPENNRLSETILTRIAKLENALDKVTKYINRDADVLETLKDPTQKYIDEIKDISTLIEWLVDFLGIKYDSSTDTWVINSSPDDPNVRLDKQEKGKVAKDGLYAALINLANRMTDRESDDKKLDVSIGKFYGGVDEIIKTDDYSLSSDLLYTQRLLYGNGKFEDKEEQKNYNISYTPVATNKENYTLNERSSKVLETAYRSLYSLPDRYRKNTSKSTEEYEIVGLPKGSDDKDALIKYLLSDNPATKANSKVPGDNTSEDLGDNILTSSSRESFFDTAESRRWNRFEAIEDQLVALRQMAFGKVGTDDKSIQANNFIKRDLGILGKDISTTFDLNNISIKNGSEFIKNFDDTNYVNIKEIGGNKFLGAHTANAEDLGSNNSTTTAATAYNIAEIDHAMIAQLLRNTFNDERTEGKGTDELDIDSPNDSLIVRIRKLRHEVYNSKELPGTDKNSYKENYDEYGIRNRLALTEKRLHDIENDDTGDDERVKLIQEKLGVNDDGWLPQDDSDAYKNSLKGMHDSLKSHVGEWNEKAKPSTPTTVCKEIEELKTEVGPNKDSGDYDESPKTLNERVYKLEKTSSKVTKEAFDAYAALGTSYNDYLSKHKIKPKPVDERLDNLEEGETTLNKKINSLETFKNSHSNYTVDSQKAIDTSHEYLNLKAIGEDYYEPKTHDSNWGLNNTSTISTRLKKLEANIVKGSDKRDDPTYPFYGEPWRDGINNSYELAKDTKKTANTNATHIGRLGSLSIIEDETQADKESHYNGTSLLFNIDTSKSKPDNEYDISSANKDASVFEGLNWLYAEINGIENGTTTNKSPEKKVGGIGKFKEEWRVGSYTEKYPYINDTLWSSILSLNDEALARKAATTDIFNDLGLDYSEGVSSKGTVSSRLEILEAGVLGKRIARKVEGTDADTDENPLSLWKRFTDLENIVGLKSTLNKERTTSNNYLMSKVGTWENENHNSVCTSIEKLENKTSDEELVDVLAEFFKKIFGKTSGVYIKVDKEQEQISKVTIQVKNINVIELIFSTSTSESLIDYNKLYFAITGRYYYKPLVNTKNICGREFSSAKLSKVYSFARESYLDDPIGIYKLQGSEGNNINLNLNSLYLDKSANGSLILQRASDILTGELKL